ncbi:MAG: Thermophilic serine proteinase [bacterium]|nr:Thermophilic serine proteinase [bacterium]
MRSRWILAVLSLLTLIFSAQVKQEKKPEAVPGEFIVKWKTTVAPQAADSLISSMSTTQVKAFPEIGVSLIKVPATGDVALLSNQLQNDPRIEYIEPNYIYRASGVPNDPQFSDLWGMNNTGQTGGTNDADIDAPEAWDTQTGSDSTLIAVIDTGVDYNHPDLAANVWTNPNEIPSNGIDDDHNGYVDDIHGWDFANNDNDPMDDNLHGTHVAGTIGAIGNNGVGVAGVNWRTKIMALKFLSGNGSGSLANAISAILYGANMKARVMNNSWGGGGFSQALMDAIQYANDHGALFVAAAGNDGSDNDQSANYPSNYEVPNVVAVAAIDHKGDLAVFGSGGGGGICGCGGSVIGLPGSNYGATTVDLAAPGKEVLSTTPNNGYQKLSGTSMATPHVTGVAGLLISQFPDWTPAQVKERLLATVKVNAGLQGKMVTGGVVDAKRALSGTTTAD